MVRRRNPVHAGFHLLPCYRVDIRECHGYQGIAMVITQSKRGQITWTWLVLSRNLHLLLYRRPGPEHHMVAPLYSQSSSAHTNERTGPIGQTKRSQMKGAFPLVGNWKVSRVTCSKCLIRCAGKEGRDFVLLCRGDVRSLSIISHWNEIGLEGRTIE